MSGIVVSLLLGISLFIIAIYRLSKVLILPGSLFFEHFVKFIKLISSQQKLGRQIVHANYEFNFVGVLIFLPLARILERILNYYIVENEIVIVGKTL